MKKKQYKDSTKTLIYIDEDYSIPSHCKPQLSVDYAPGSVKRFSLAEIKAYEAAKRANNVKS